MLRPLPDHNKWDSFPPAFAFSSDAEENPTGRTDSAEALKKWYEVLENLNDR